MCAHAQMHAQHSIQEETKYDEEKEGNSLVVGHILCVNYVCTRG